MRFRKKNFLPISSLCSARSKIPRQRGRHRGLSLAAATAAATTAFAFSTSAVAEYIQFIHGIHLLSYRRLSMQ